MWFLYIFGGLFLLFILAQTGILSEFFAFLIMVGVCALLAHWIFDASGAGVIVGGVLYLIFCIARIVSDDYSISFYENGAEEKVTERSKGIAGIVMLVILTIILLCN